MLQSEGGVTAGGWEVFALFCFWFALDCFLAFVVSLKENCFIELIFFFDRTNGSGMRFPF